MVRLPLLVQARPGAGIFLTRLGQKSALAYATAQMASGAKPGARPAPTARTGEIMLTDTSITRSLVLDQSVKIRVSGTAAAPDCRLAGSRT
jgi:hypothetical protein